MRPSLFDDVCSWLQRVGQTLLLAPANQALAAPIVKSPLALSRFSHGLQWLLFRSCFDLMVQKRLRVTSSNSLVDISKETTWQGFLAAPTWLSLAIPSATGPRSIWKSYTSFAPSLSRFVLADDVCEELVLEVEQIALGCLPAGGEPVVDDWVSWSRSIGFLYESMLALHPIWDNERSVLTLVSEHGSGRKRSGTYFTPEPLLEAVISSVMEPFFESIQGILASDALRDVRVCDPACGAGYFLLHMARYVAERCHPTLSENEPGQRQALLRRLLLHNVYGVDLRPLAVLLARLSLWCVSGAPLSDLLSFAHRIRCGNSLFGATLEAMSAPFPERMIAALSGDDKRAVSTAKRAFHAMNRSFAKRGVTRRLDALFKEQECETGATLAEGEPQVVQLALFGQESRQLSLWDLADAWCGMFVWPRTDGDATEFSGEDWLHALRGEAIDVGVSSRLSMLATQYQWFHWELAFPEVFGDKGGFDFVVGNPPWERVKLQEREWFATRAPEIARKSRASERRQLIASLEQDDPALFTAYQAARRTAEGTSHFLRQSGLFPLAGRGDVNLYMVFLELGRRILSPCGRLGLLIPSGIATDHTARFFFQALQSSGELEAFFDFENSARYFPTVSSRFRFCLLLLRGAASSNKSPPSFLFFGRHPDDRLDKARLFSLSYDELSLLNPNTLTCPLFRSRRDAELTLSIYRRLPILAPEDESQRHPGLPVARFVRMFDMTNDSSSFMPHQNVVEKKDCDKEGHLRIVGEERYWPLYEGKMYDAFDHRMAHVVTTENAARPGQPKLLTDAEHLDPGCYPMPQYWVAESIVRERHVELVDREWLLTFKDVTSPTNSRTCLATILPRAAVANSSPLLLLEGVSARLAACYCAQMNAFVFDYVARQKISSLHLNFFIVKQLPFLLPQQFEDPCCWSPGDSLSDWIVARVVSLVCTSWDVMPFARDCGVVLSHPFAWEPEARWEMRCELDAAFFLLFGCSREEVAYVMDTFPVIRKREESEWGSFRSKERILELFSTYAEAIC